VEKLNFINNKTQKIMRKITFGLLLCSFALQSFAVHPPLAGFNYGTQSAPAGDEWQSPENLSLNKEQPRAYFFSFQDRESARKVLPEIIAMCCTHPAAESFTESKKNVCPNKEFPRCTF
jgi:hypothetical protein